MARAYMSLKSVMAAASFTAIILLLLETLAVTMILNGANPAEERFKWVPGICNDVDTSRLKTLLITFLNSIVSTTGKFQLY